MLLVTGATGFLGEHVVERLLASGETPICLVRPTSQAEKLEAQGLPLRYGDLNDLPSLVKAFAGVDCLVNIASLGFGHAPNILQACHVAGVKRAVFVSTTAIFTAIPAATKSIRVAAERHIQESSLTWTIIRPTMIYGTGRDRNMARLVRYLARYPFIPVLGSGAHLQQPVHVQDVAEAVVSAIGSPRAHYQAYNISGAAPLTYDEVIRSAARAIGARPLIVHIPLPPAVAALQLYERFARRPKLKAEQALRLNEDKAFSHEDATRDLGYNPRRFEEGIAEEVELLLRQEVTA